MSPIGTAVEEGIILKQNQFEELNLKGNDVSGLVETIDARGDPGNKVIGKLLGRYNVPALADPNLQIRGWGGGGHPDPETRGIEPSKKDFSRPFGPQFAPKVREAGPPSPSLGSATDP